MKIFSRQTLNTFIIGICVGITAILTYMLLTGNLPWLKAAGVGTGAPDVNARYLDGYVTSLSAGTSKIYISDGSNYLPDSTVDTGAIVNGTIVTGDIATDTILAGNIATDTILAGNIAAGAVGTSEIADGTIANVDLASAVAPSGMIAMFDTDCPSGWTRVTELDGKSLTAGASYNAAAGGTDNQTLTVEQLPAHSHTGTTNAGGNHTHTYTDFAVSGGGGGTYWTGDTSGATVVGTGRTTGSSGTHTHTFTTGEAGGTQSFDNRSTFATIVICKKD